MRLAATISAALALCTTSHAWEITLYTDKSCAEDNGDYLILSGSGNSASRCFFLGGKLPSGVGCKKYTEGGNKGPFGCSDHEFSDAYSFAISSGDFYLADSRSKYSRNCSTGFGSKQTGCQSIHVRGFSASG